MSALDGVPAEVRIVEVGPRDGLQNEPRHLPAVTRIELIRRLVDAGLRTVEAGAFVSPRWVPAMADSAAVLHALPERDDVSFPVLVPNLKGLEAALEAGAREVAVFGAASETFSQKNINCSIAESLERFRPVAESARANGLRVRGYVSCVLGCPYEGAIAPTAVARVVDGLLALDCYEISLGDTIGVGTPRKVEALLDAVVPAAGTDRLAAHFHDTYGQALANVLTALERGVAVVDSSVGGLGGCPYARGASGNLATEDLLYMLDGMGVRTGVALAGLVETARWIAEQLDRPPASRVARALA